MKTSSMIYQRHRDLGILLVPVFSVKTKILTAEEMSHVKLEVAFTQKSIIILEYCPTARCYVPIAIGRKAISNF